ncbi:phosphoglucosamine mutase [Salinibius halmophilus]|uniref:phosphoglucosamine mutase n=1 Tax=Salinibius halmophilus TaxID=1853216 RepID=UPI000E674FCB|nr:phosphoglucosamine mutase [Salinibius halmophilus]
MAKYFGTDGIRGRVGEQVMTPMFAMQFGWAVGKSLVGRAPARVLIGKDTRRSGYMLESAIEAGLSAAGVEVLLVGPLPTPAIAQLSKAFNCGAGIVISASHNPHYDNGLKVFSAQGGKLTDEHVHLIESLIDSEMSVVPSDQLGKATRLNDAPGRYIEYCKATCGYLDLSGFSIVVDGANGAAYQVAARVFEELGARVETIHCQPNGVNINDDCGATNPRSLQSQVLARGADLGVALDGDADRLILVDANGQVVDGDQIVYLLAKSMRQQKGLVGGVVGTKMSNMALELAVEQLGLQFARSDVGDRYVAALLAEKDWLLGGESSGHVICRNVTETGDGIVTALQVLAVLQQSGLGLHQYLDGFQLFPQVLINVPVTSAEHIMQNEQLQKDIADCQKVLDGHGRLLIRPSGTEPLIRVMVEADQHELAKSLAVRIARTIAELKENIL